MFVRKMLGVAGEEARVGEEEGLMPHGGRSGTVDEECTNAEP